MNRYMSGSLVTVSAVFVNKAGVPTNPTTTTFKYRKDDGSTTTVTPTNDSPGNFHFDLDTTGWTGPGDQIWTYQFQGIGNVVAIGSNIFGVYPPSL
jgi:hypothetical protein